MTGEDKKKVLAVLDKLMEGTSGVVRATIEDCRSAIGQMQEYDGWISVAGRLPKKNGRFICSYRFHSNSSMPFVGVLDYYAFDQHPHWQHESAGVIVTHWMPIPEPPKEDAK